MGAPADGINAPKSGLRKACPDAPAQRSLKPDFGPRLFRRATRPSHISNARQQKLIHTLFTVVVSPRVGQVNDRFVVIKPDHFYRGGGQDRRETHLWCEPIEPACAGGSLNIRANRSIVGQVKQCRPIDQIC